MVYGWFANRLKTAKGITVRCTLSPTGRGQGEGCENPPVIPFAVLTAAVAAVLVAAAASMAWWLWPADLPGEDATSVPRPPRISPDYSGIVLPPNIAPLDFFIQEEGRRFLIRLYGQAGDTVEIASRSPAVVIPIAAWRRLLEENRGQEMRIDIFASAGGQWRRYQSIVNRIAEYPIDPYLVYRLIPPVHKHWRDVAVHQRDLTTFDDSVVLDGEALGEACVNCHSFPANDPRRMLIGVRSSRLGRVTLLADEGHVQKLDKPFGYTAWHPDGRIAVYSTNKVHQFFHAAGPEVRNVVDLESSLAYYRDDTRESKSVPGASDARHLATYPAWSPDGRQLYYCRRRCCGTTARPCRPALRGSQVRPGPHCL